MRSAILAIVLVAFALASLAAPFGRLCLRLGPGESVAVGSCCCDAGARGARDHDVHDDCCDERGSCVDIQGAHEPLSSPDTRPADLPGPEIVARAFDFGARFLPTAVGGLRAAPPPRVADPPPIRTRILRC